MSSDKESSNWQELASGEKLSAELVKARHGEYKELVLSQPAASNSASKNDPAPFVIVGSK